MTHKYFPHTAEDISAMLKAIGVTSLEDLYADVPENLRLDKELNLPPAHSEIEVRQKLQELSAKNQPLVCFAGDGVYDHYTPSVIPYLASRSEFQTSYTPYQAEVSQGTLQYIFEYQSMMAELTGMDVTNASMYDGTTATAEAMMMAVAAAKKRNKVLLSSTLPPRLIREAQTYARYHGIQVELIAATNGVTDRADLMAKLAQGDAAGVVLPQPNYYGIVEDLTGVADACHEQKTLLILNAQASPLGVLKTPGEWGADIACGEAQSLGIPLSFGGPYIGYLCCRQALLRKMPGRLVGGTTDTQGRRVFVLTMQAREQHIRREKATSNICTSQGIMCLYVAIYLSLMGPSGLKEVNEQSYSNAHYLCDALTATGKFNLKFDQPFFNEFCLQYTGHVETFIARCAQEGILAGVKAEGLDNCLLVAVTENRTSAEMERFINLAKEIS